jgi:hypothetical protein
LTSLIKYGSCNIKVFNILLKIHEKSVKKNLKSYQINQFIPARVKSMVGAGIFSNIIIFSVGNLKFGFKVTEILLVPFWCLSYCHE